MSNYIDDSLIAGEEVVHRARLTWWSQAGFLIVGALLAAALAGIVFFARDRTVPLDAGHVAIMAAVVAVVALICLVIASVKMRSTEIAITTKRVIAKFGFVTRHTVEINLDKVESLRVEQGVWGRMLNYGTILISGSGTAVAPIPNIADPLVFRRKFMEATDRPISMPRER
jgi:uncharacterized membrane protein YdbT with pleckstrin-like domain